MTSDLVTRQSLPGKIDTAGLTLTLLCVNVVLSYNAAWRDRDLDACGADHVHDTSLTFQMPTRQPKTVQKSQARRPPAEDLGLI